MGFSHTGKSTFKGKYKLKKYFDFLDFHPFGQIQATLKWEFSFESFPFAWCLGGGGVGSQTPPPVRWGSELPNHSMQKVSSTNFYQKDNQSKNVTSRELGFFLLISKIPDFLFQTFYLSSLLVCDWMKLWITKIFVGILRGVKRIKECDNLRGSGKSWALASNFISQF